MRTIDYFDKQARLRPDKPMLRFQDEELTYQDVADLTHRLGGAMLDDGIKAQERVAILSPNDPSVIVALLALWRVNAVWIPINTRNAMDANAVYLEYVGAGWLFFHSHYRDQAYELARRVPAIRNLICLDQDDSDASGLAGFMRPAGAPPVSDLGDVNGNDADLAAIIATGGTTGPAKGVRVINRSWGTMLETIATEMRCDDPVFLSTAPLTHAAGPMAMAAAAMGATNVILPTFDARAVIEAIGRHRVTHMFLPPTALYSMLSDPEVERFDYSSLRFFLLAGSPVSPDKLRRAVDVFGPCMCQSYGQTECHMIATWLPPEVVAAAARGINPQRLASCGRPTASLRVELMDDDGNLVPLGESGEIVARGGIVGGGYLDLPEATAESRAHGWHHTGDVGRFDTDGFLYIVDRKKDMIVTGGFNVFSAEVEAAVMELDAIAECAVIGIPDEKWGEAVTAIVVGDADEAAIIAHCKQRIGSVKAPKRVIRRPALPRTSVGKLDKKALRSEFWGATDRAVN